MPKEQTYKETSKKPPKKNSNPTYQIEDCEDNSTIRLEGNSCLRDFFFIFLNKIINSGSKFPYQLKMLYKVNNDFIFAPDAKQFKIFLTEKLRNNGKFTYLTLWWYFRKYVGLGSFQIFCADFVQILFPIFLKKFVNWLIEENSEQHKGYVFLAVLVLTMIVKTFFTRKGILNYSRAHSMISNRLGVRRKIVNKFIRDFWPIKFRVCRLRRQGILTSGRWRLC